MHTAVLAGLRDPDRAFLVLLVGLVLIYRECVAPGRVLPGVAGAVFAISAVYSLLQHPWSVVGVMLLATGLALVTAQAFGTWWWIPGVAGAVCLYFGARELVVIPRIRPFSAALSLPFAFITVVLLRTAIQARRNKRSVQ